MTESRNESLEILRHSTAHVLAQAVVRIFGAEVKYTIGPALMDDFQYGFYYDFDLPEGVTLKGENLPKIAKWMRKIIAQKLPIERIELPVAEARQKMSDLGQTYKVEMIDDLQAEDPDLKSVSLYQQGEFLDLCRGPHLEDTSQIPDAFELLSVAGAYWRGDETKKMLTRIYGIAFETKDQLSEHLERVAEAKKRDHRILGKQLELFAFSDEVGPGLPMWLPHGTVIRMELEGWLRGELQKRGYQPVITPHIGRLELWRTSGHYPYYEHGLFPTMQTDEAGDEGFLLKPMNCPFHIQIFKTAQRSYRQLPLRLAEFGTVYRFEQSGELSGLTRVRGFTQDDAHIFCTPEQIESEIESCVELTQLCLSTLGLDDYRVRIGLRDPDDSKYVGPAESWDRAEANIRSVVKRLGMDYTEEKGEAAFYGPKIDFVVTDCIGREWQLGTVQVDYNLPERFGLEYIGADNTAHRPVMIHRAPLGSPERFIGILIEHFAGAFPLWLAPVQVAVLPVSDKFLDYADSVAARLTEKGLRVEADRSADKIGAKIRRSATQKIPYQLIVGAREEEAKSVSVRKRTVGDLGAMDVEAFIEAMLRERDTRGTESLEKIP